MGSGLIWIITQTSSKWESLCINDWCYVKDIVKNLMKPRMLCRLK
uniref:SRCR domain-containing protein n=1 Tax=Anguilla anguilla TaxID=7936 RepID=A0A0E9VFQ2_ANGAN